MKKADKTFFKEKLIAMRREILMAMKNIKENENENTSKEASGDLSSYSFHLADQGTDSMDHQRNFIFAEMDSAVLHDIDAALEKIEDSTYGICELCEQEIPRARLEFIPYARFCVECQAKEEDTSNKESDESTWDYQFPMQEEEYLPE